MSNIELTDFAQLYVTKVFDRYGVPTEMPADEFIKRYRVKSRQDCSECAIVDMCRGYVYLGNDYLCHVLESNAAKKPYKSPHGYVVPIPNELATHFAMLGKLKSAQIEARINRHLANGTRPASVDYAKKDYSHKVSFSLETEMYRALRAWGDGFSKVGLAMLIAELAREQIVVPHSRQSRTPIYVYPELLDQSESSVPKA